MFEGLATLSAFHLLRPYWLLAIVPMVWVWWTIRFRPDGQRSEESPIAPHLLKALTRTSARQKRITAVDTVLVAFCFVALSVAGPTWSKKQNPFAPPTPPAVVVVEVSQSMLAKDIQPSRLERAKHKIRDFTELRAGAPTALIAFAGSAHVVLPLTDDPTLFIPFLEGLDPEVMPKPGQRVGEALELADALLREEQNFGAVVVFADGIGPAAVEIVRAMAEREDRVLAALPLSETESSSFRDFATVSLTPDNRDMKRLESRISAAYQSSLVGDDSESWDDRGWLFLWPALIITLLWFRKGWTMRWAAQALVLLFVLNSPANACAETWQDAFVTYDQQGRYAFEHKDFESAARFFIDPIWKGLALYNLGKYEEAAKSFAELDTAQANYNRGNAHVKAGDYVLAIEAYETVLKIDPSHDSTQRNLQVARAILAKLTKDREESGLGDQQEIKADEVKFDKQAERGKETKMVGGDKMKLESAEKWMRTVNTEVKDFLALKFAEDYARRSK
jgi:Ca-activated chloride channel family protein